MLTGIGHQARTPLPQLLARRPGTDLVYDALDRLAAQRIHRHDSGRAGLEEQDVDLVHMAVHGDHGRVHDLQHGLACRDLVPRLHVQRRNYAGEGRGDHRRLQRRLRRDTGGERGFNVRLEYGDVKRIGTLPKVL